MRHVFISYSRDDIYFAQILLDRVKRSGFAAWMDMNLNAGENWRSEIDDAIRDALAIIVVLSPSAIRSSYVNYEWAFALGAGIPVLPVLLKQPDTELPARLSLIHRLDFSNHLAQPWEALTKALSEYADAQRAFTIHVPRHAPPVVQEAARALDSMDARQRQAAMESLRQMNHPAVVDVLAEAVRHPLQDVRIPAAIQLVDHQDIRALPALLEGIRISGQRGVHWEIHAYTLAKLGDAGVPRLIEALADEDLRVRRTVLLALGQIGGNPAIAAVHNCLGDAEPRIRADAVSSLAETGDSAVLAELLRLKQDPASEVRGKLASALRHLRVSSVVPYLTDLLKDPDRDVRNAAAWSLQEAGDSTAVPALVDALYDEYGQTQMAAGRALQKIAEPAAIPGLLRATPTADSQLLYVIEDALKSFGVTALPALRQSLHEESPRLRAMALRVLESVGDESDIPQMLELLRDESAGVRYYATRALSRFRTPEVVQAMIERLQDEDEDVCKLAAGTLGSMRDPASVPHLIDSLQDEFVAAAAANALESIGTRSARAALRAWKREHNQGG